MSKIKLLVLLFWVLTVASCKKANTYKRNGFTYNNMFIGTELLGIRKVSGAPGLEIGISSPWIDSSEMMGRTGYPFSDFSLFMNSPVDTDLVAGTYVPGDIWSGNPYVFNMYDFIHIGCDTTVDFATFSCTDYLTITGGNINVEREGNIYIINYSFDIDNGQKLVGYYKDPYDYFHQ